MSFRNLESLNGQPAEYILQKMFESRMIKRPIPIDIDFENHKPEYIQEIESSLNINFQAVIFPWVKVNDLNKIHSFVKNNTGWFFFDQVEKEDTIFLSGNTLIYTGGNYVVKQTSQAKGVFHTFHLKCFIVNWFEMINDVEQQLIEQNVISSPDDIKRFQDNPAFREKVKSIVFSL